MRRALKSGYGISDRGQRILLILTTGVWLVTAAISAVLAVFLPLVFDRPGNLFNPLAWLAVLLGGLFWAVCLLAPLVGWMQWRKNRRTQAWAAMAAPAAWGAAALTALQLVPN